MKRISQFTLPGDLDLDMLYEKGRIGYSFMYKNNNYGNSVTLKHRGIEDIMAACMVLFTNALETKKELEKDSAKNNDTK